MHPCMPAMGQKLAYIINTELNPELSTNTHTHMRPVVRGNKSAKS